MPALTITGTDTGVGKTIVTASLAAALLARGQHICVRKPFATGIDLKSPAYSLGNDDAALLAAAAGLPTDQASLFQIRPISLRAPLAPLNAARLEDTEIPTSEVATLIRRDAARCEIMLIEGVGGAAVPISPTVLFSDFARELNYPVLIVARTTLGTINHTLLTIEHLQSRQIPIAGLIFVRHSAAPPDQAEQLSPDTITEISGCRNFGVVPNIPTLISATTPVEAAALLPINDPAIQELASYIAQSSFVAPAS